MTPTELAAMADLFWETRIKRLAADKEAAALKTEESRLEAKLTEEMRANGLTAIGGKRVRLSIPTEPEFIPTVENWEKLWNHIVATRDFSFLEKRVGKAAVKERWADDQDVPGVIKFPVFKLSKSEVK